jgi:tRNA(Ile2) C34 agmatinyltransferase TiaS
MKRAKRALCPVCGYELNSKGQCMRCGYCGG